MGSWRGAESSYSTTVAFPEAGPDIVGKDIVLEVTIY
jgi:hypothetical protein